MVFRRKEFQLSEEYADLLLSEQNASNFRHMKDVTLVMVLIVLVLLLQHLFFPREMSLSEYDDEYRMIFILTITAGSLFLLIPKVSNIKVSERNKKIFFLIYLYCLAFFYMGMTYFDLHYGQELSGYIIILMFISTITWLNPGEFAFISGFAYFLLILSYLILSSYQQIQIFQFVQATIYYVLSWVLFLSISRVRIENLSNRITMESQYEMLETESATDPLTGLYNRRHMKDEAEKELARSERSGTKFCIVLLDLDHFKKVNDNYGHIAGDEVLKEMSAILRSSVRLSDKVFRYGGEEFMILLPDTSRGDAGILAERIRERVENYSFSAVRRKITLSAGISQSSPGCSRELLIQRADKRLYLAKEGGRNTVVGADEPPGDESSEE